MTSLTRPESSTPALSDSEEWAVAADWLDIRQNPRVQLRAAVTALPYKDRACRVCAKALPARTPAAEFRFVTARKRWSWHYCLDHAPEAVEPLDERRALRYLAQAFASAKSAEALPGEVWSVIVTLRTKGVPF